MRNTTLLRTWLTMLLLFAGVGMSWGEEQVVYTLDATLEANKGKDNAYDNAEDILIDDITWNVTGNSTMSPWRIGGKSLSKTERTVYSKTAYTKALTKVSLEIGTASSVTINSIKLLYSTSTDFTNATSISSSGTSANAIYEFAPVGGFPINSYFKFVFNITISSTSNKFIEFKNIKFYAEEESSTPKYDITVASNISNGSVTADPTSAAEGATITLTATPNEGYELGSWKVINVSTSEEISVTDNKFIMPKANVNVNATFIERQHKEGEYMKITIDQSTITNPKTTTSPIYGTYNWSTGKISGVYNGAIGSSLTNFQFNYSATNTDNYRDREGVYNTTAIPGKIKSIQMTTSSGTDRNWTAYVSNTAITHDNLSNATSLGTKKIALDGTTFDVEDGNYCYFYLEYKTGSASYIKDIVIEYEAADMATISIASACTDGEKCYSTYSNASSWVVPANLTVSEISIVDGALYVKSYKTSDVVPANTGVMVSATEGGEYNILIETDPETLELAESVLGEDNCLHPSSEAMTGDNLFYRLTMHNGTQIGFAWGAPDGATFTLAANKAYLAVPKSASVKSLVWFTGEEDAIKNVEEKTFDTVIYDMQGRKVSKAQKGLYIINGRKVVK